MNALMKQSYANSSEKREDLWVSELKTTFAKQGMAVFRHAWFNMNHHAATLDRWERFFRLSIKDVVDTVIECFEDMCHAKPEFFRSAHTLTIGHIPTNLLSPEQLTRIDTIISDTIDKGIMWYDWFSSVRRLIQTTRDAPGLKQKIQSTQMGVFFILMNLQRKSHAARRTKLEALKN